MDEPLQEFHSSAVDQNFYQASRVALPGAGKLEKRNESYDTPGI